MTGKRNLGRKPGSLNKGHVGFTPAEHDAVVQYKILNRLTYQNIADMAGTTRHKLFDILNEGAGMTPEMKKSILELCEVRA